MFVEHPLTKPVGLLIMKSLGKTINFKNVGESLWRVKYKVLEPLNLFNYECLLWIDM